MESKTSNQTKARLIVLAVFAIGLIAGALSMNLYQRATSTNSERREHANPQDYIIKKMTNRLNLSSQQQDQIRAILEDTFNQYGEIKKDIEPRMDAVRQQGRNRIRALLSPEQLPEFEKMAAEQDKLRERSNDKKK